MIQYGNMTQHRTRVTHAYGARRIIIHYHTSLRPMIRGVASAIRNNMCLFVDAHTTHPKENDSPKVAKARP